MTQFSNLLVLDACCLLNLYATERMRDIVVALSHRVAVAGYVLEQEALFVWRPVLAEARDEQVPVDLSALVEEGLLQVLRLEHQEEEAMFVDFAALMDDGEAITGALALHRGYGVATDDRKARRIFANRAPTVPLTSTLELLKQWADQSHVAQEELLAAVLAMQSGASYVPRQQDPLYNWWLAIMGGEAP